MDLQFYFPKEKEETEFSRNAMEACEHLIAEMGAEVHDDLIQRLSVFRLSIDKLERLLSDRALAEAQLVAMKGEFQEVIQSVRRVSRKLTPVKSQPGTLHESVSLLCQNMERPDSGSIHFHAEGDELPLSQQTETYLLRIVQELVHNAYKHSSAWHVWVRFTWSGDSLLVEVEDDGTGFSKVSDFVEVLERKYNTLRMRCIALGADIQYVEGKRGLIVRVNMPVMAEEEARLAEDDGSPALL